MNIDVHRARTSPEASRGIRGDARTAGAPQREPASTLPAAGGDRTAPAGVEGARKLHTTYALLPDAARAEAATNAILELRTAGDSHVTLVAHHDTVALEEPHARQDRREHDESLAADGPRVLVGSCVGKTGGALLAGPLQLQIGSPLVRARWSGGSSTRAGTTWSRLRATHLPDHALRRLAQDLPEASVLLRIQTCDAATHEGVGAILREHGARIVGPPPG